MLIFNTQTKCFMFLTIIQRLWFELDMFPIKKYRGTLLWKVEPKSLYEINQALLRKIGNSNQKASMRYAFSHI